MVSAAPPRARVRPAATLALLAVACVSYVLQQTLVVPALPTIQRDLDTTTTWVTWVFTGFLLTSAVATPLLGKLGDTYGKKRLLVIVMLIFLAGTVGAALADSIAALIAARALQGAAGALFPLAFGIVRDELPPGRVGMGLGLLSATFGVGGAAGLVLSGLILESLHWSWLFWIGALPVAGAVVLVWRMVPESPVRTPSRLDWRGALTLSAGLASLLLALSEGERWGWLSPATLGVLVASALLLCLWVWVELRVPEPMVEIAMMRDRAVLWTNVVALMAGFAMFGTFLLVPTFVQMGAGLPEALSGRVDYGFAAGVITAGLFLLPSSAVMLVVGPVGGILEGRVGARALTAAGRRCSGSAASCWRWPTRRPPRSSSRWS
jgi:MFS family permease